MAKYEVAIIVDGQIVKVVPQEQYNQAILSQNQTTAVGVPNHETSSVCAEQTITAQTTANTAVQTTPQITVQPLDTAGNMIQEKAVKPLTTFAVFFILALVLSVVSAIVYRAVTGNKLSKQAFEFISAILIAVILWGFFKFVF